MDPQSLSFTPSNDFWQLSGAMKSIQERQQEHAERLVRLERRTDDSTRMKSLWDSSSFPSVLGGTPQHGPTQQPPDADFSNFDDDDQSNNLVRSLQLDADDEPRRLGTTSRANSVRFDESANQGQWAHAHRSSADFVPRTTGFAGLGHPLIERTSSHKSDGRHSSAGQSAMSGRANSLGLEASLSLGSTPLDGPPGLAPGLFILGSVPSIIRCWMTTDFKHDLILYAAVCTGSYKSLLDMRLIESLDLSNQIRHDINGERRIKLAVYLPEAVPHTLSSRSSSPAPQMPTLNVDFSVVEHDDGSPERAIQIFLGSDMLRAYNADVLLSSNSITMYDDNGCKLSIPLVRPENDETFKTLFITSASSSIPRLRRPYSDLHGPGSSMELKSLPNGVIGSGQHEMARASFEDDKSRNAEVKMEDPIPKSISASEQKSRPSQNDDRQGSLSKLNTTRSEHAEQFEPSEQTSPVTGNSRSATTPAIWSNWRREGVTSATNPGSDWARSTRESSASYSRPNREQGIKVLRPSRQASRSSVGPISASPTTSGQSRFFDEGKRRIGLVASTTSPAGGSGSDSGDSARDVRAQASMEVGNGRPSAVKENVPAAAISGAKTRTNPIGGGSAFGWLNPGQTK